MEEAAAERARFRRGPRPDPGAAHPPGRRGPAPRALQEQGHSDAQPALHALPRRVLQAELGRQLRARLLRQGRRCQARAALDLSLEGGARLRRGVAVPRPLAVDAPLARGRPLGHAVHTWPPRAQAGPRVRHGVRADGRLPDDRRSRLRGQHAGGARHGRRPHPVGRHGDRLGPPHVPRARSPLAHRGGRARGHADAWARGELQGPVARGRARHLAVPLSRGATHGQGHDRHLPGVPMRHALMAAAAVAAVLAAPAAAHASSVFVFAQNQAFSPTRLDVLPGDTVIWRNTSQKTHNVKFETEGYDSGRFGPGDVRNHPFPTAGVYDYHCTIHTGMVGQVGVYPLVLEGPATRIRRGKTIALGVRAPDGASDVTIEADFGSGFVPVAGATPVVPGPGHQGHDAPGELHADVVASETATYRAAFAGGTSNELRVEVTDAPDLAARARPTRRGTTVTVTANPVTRGARVVLQINLRERFGWWPVKRARLDGRSRASFV